MQKRFVLSLLLLLFLSLFIHGCSNSSSDSVTNEPAILNLAGSKQGLSVGFADFDGDGINDKFVGAPYAATATSPYTGAVLVYKGASAEYSTIATALLTGDDNYGFSFANLGDVDGDGKDDFAVGAIHGDGTDVSLSGSVHVYKGGGSGKVIAKLSGEWPMDKFGFSLASGDLNDDGNKDIIVGAPFNTNDPALYQSGAVYVYSGPDFATRAALHASSANKGIGWTVAAGDINGDGVSDLLISASGKLLGYYGGSSFAPSIDSPGVMITCTASGFGKAIAVIGDIDGVPGGEIAVGAPNAAVTISGASSRDAGSVYVIKGASAGTINVSAATPPAELIARMDGEALFSRFGASLAPVGDVDSGGKPDFTIGAPMADADWNILSGKVYLFKGEDIAAGNPWSHSSVFTGMVKNQGYGTSLAFGSGRLLIGAPRSNTDTGGVAMVDPATGQAVPGGSSGGSTGGSGDCH